jgi:predicted metal-dependent HD superfamily phosphohydrolase
MDATELPLALAPLPAGLAPPGEFWRLVHDGYQTPPRHYHTLDHVVEVARWYHVVARELGWTHPREVFLAVLFHDIVYRVGATDNEQRSASAAVDAVRAGLGDGIDTDLVTKLILLTARHGGLSAGDVDAEAALFLDCDMAILGAPAAEYDHYEQGVASEYLTLYPPALYAQGRQRFLAGLLARERIYLSPFFHDRLEAPARDNLRRALARS